MREETAREFIEALNRGCELLNEATGMKATADDVIRRGSMLLESVPPAAQKAARKQGAMGFLLSIPEPSADEKSKFLTVAKNLPFLLRNPVKKFANMLPYKRKGGKPPAFDGDKEKERQSCQEVSMLIGCGVELLDALERVASKNEISSRTMRRAWKRWIAAQRTKSTSRRAS